MKEILFKTLMNWAFNNLHDERLNPALSQFLTDEKNLAKLNTLLKKLELIEENSAIISHKNLKIKDLEFSLKQKKDEVNALKKKLEQAESALKKIDQYESKTPSSKSYEEYKTQPPKTRFMYSADQNVPPKNRNNRCKKKSKHSIITPK